MWTCGGPTLQLPHQKCGQVLAKRGITADQLAKEDAEVPGLLEKLYHLDKIPEVQGEDLSMPDMGAIPMDGDTNTQTRTDTRVDTDTWAQTRTLMCLSVHPNTLPSRVQEC